MYDTHFTNLIFLDFCFPIIIICEEYKLCGVLLHEPVQTFSAPFSENFSVYILPLQLETKSQTYKEVKNILYPY
jgi:hypothetical protein